MADQYEVLTRTDAGTPMGEFMRQYWIPAVLSNELVADGAPVRLKLLGEKLIAFRDSAGRVGIMDHRCPHRCASLFYGRNEEDGIRCVYHGWKYDVDGNCVDIPNIPPGRGFKDKVHARAYLTAEHKGLVWVYMGERARAPALPPFEVCSLPEERIEYRFVQRRCNWLQALEGDLDTSHVGFLHFGGVHRETAGAGRTNIVANRAPDYKIADAPWGLSYGAFRPASETETYWRVAQFLFPFWAMPPISSIGKNILTRAWVPLDDEHCMFVGIAEKGYLDEEGDPPTGATLIDRVHPNSTDWLGRYRMVECEENDYFLDRETQKHGSFTGIEGIHVQDQAMTEGMGAIVDRSLETLAASDAPIARMRRVLLRAVQDFGAGNRPPAADAPETYAGVRGGHYVTTENGDWLEVHRRQVGDHPLLAEAASA
jgi:phenylpropionate dioxygenase-like ring-hydroxylating dioxygenase large terminal subunit